MLSFRPPAGFSLFNQQFPGSGGAAGGVILRYDTP